MPETESLNDPLCPISHSRLTIILSISRLSLVLHFRNPILHFHADLLRDAEEERIPSNLLPFVQVVLVLAAVVVVLLETLDFSVVCRPADPANAPIYLSWPCGRRRRLCKM
jgi:hypothetical protein